MLKQNGAISIRLHGEPPNHTWMTWSLLASPVATCLRHLGAGEVRALFNQRSHCTDSVTERAKIYKYIFKKKTMKINYIMPDISAPK